MRFYYQVGSDKHLNQMMSERISLRTLQQMAAKKRRKNNKQYMAPPMPTAEQQSTLLGVLQTAACNVIARAPHTLNAQPNGQFLEVTVITRIVGEIYALMKSLFYKFFVSHNLHYHRSRSLSNVCCFKINNLSDLHVSSACAM